MTIYDAVIVGAGPAGSTCARALRRAGLDVAILDKQAFPRDKVCAGWITPPVVAATELDLADYARTLTLEPLRGFAVAFGKHAPVEIDYDETVAYGIRRCEFDHYLLRRSGAATVLGQPLKSIRRRQGVWVINDSIEAPLVVGAAGHFCPIAQFLGATVGRSEHPITAQEIEFLDTGSTAELIPTSGRAPALFFCEDLKGYGWIFRKGPYVNIGFGREDANGLPQSTRDFWSWLVSRGLAPADLRPRFQGHAYLSRQQSTRRLFDEGVILIGDSAGLADPVSGEGIRPAVESALLAARAIQACEGIYTRSRLSAYTDLIRAHFGPAGAPRASIVPRSVRAATARMMMKSRWLTRHVILDRGFLGRPS